MDDIEEISAEESRIKTFAEFINSCCEETEYSDGYKKIGQGAITTGKIETPIGGWLPSDEARRSKLEKLNKILAALDIDALLFKKGPARQYALTEPACNFFHHLLFLISEDELSLIRKKKFDQVSPKNLAAIRMHLISAVDSMGISIKKRREVVRAFEQQTGCPSLFGTYEVCALTDKTKAEMIRVIAAVNDEEKYLDLHFMDDSMLPIPEEVPWWDCLFSAMLEDYTRRVAPAFIDRWKHIAKDLCTEESSDKSYLRLIEELETRYP